VIHAGVSRRRHRRAPATSTTPASQCERKENRQQRHHHGGERSGSAVGMVFIQEFASLMTVAKKMVVLRPSRQVRLLASPTTGRDTPAKTATSFATELGATGAC
jgi:hypothetical protein